MRDHQKIRNNAAACCKATEQTTVPHPSSLSQTPPTCCQSPYTKNQPRLCGCTGGFTSPVVTLQSCGLLSQDEHGERNNSCSYASRRPLPAGPGVDGIGSVHMQSDLTSSETNETERTHSRAFLCAAPCSKQPDTQGFALVKVSGEPAKETVLRFTSPPAWSSQRHCWPYGVPWLLYRSRPC
jgi:hypothetical protein